MTIIKKIFIFVKIIFIVVILLIGALVIMKPYGIDVVKVIPVMLDKNPTSTYNHPYLNTKQEAVLESAGINLEKLPAQITPQQQQCTISILGINRVNEIIAGSTPSLIEVLKTKKCFGL